MDAYPIELQDRPASDEKAVHDALIIASAPSTTKSKLEALPAEVQQEVFKHYFRSFEIELRPFHQPYTNKRWSTPNVSRPFPKIRLLAWSPFPGPISLVLTSRGICSVALPLLGIHVTRSLRQDMDETAKATVLPLAEVDFAHHAALVKRIQRIYAGNEDVMEELSYMIDGGKEVMRDSLQVVEMDYHFDKPSGHWRRNPAKASTSTRQYYLGNLCQ